MGLMLAIWSPQPNWMPRKPKLMFQICQKLRRGFCMEALKLRVDKTSSINHLARQSSGKAIQKHEHAVANLLWNSAEPTLEWRTTNARSTAEPKPKRHSVRNSTSRCGCPHHSFN